MIAAANPAPHRWFSRLHSGTAMTPVEGRVRGREGPVGTLLREHSRSDPRGYAAGVREAVLEAKVGVSAMRDGLAGTERELASERTPTGRRRAPGAACGRNSGRGDRRLAERYAARHRERVAVLERKLEVQREELALAEREVAEMIAEYRSARGGRGRTRSRRPGATSKPPGASGRGPRGDDDRLRAESDRKLKEQAVEAQLAFLKKKFKKSTVRCGREKRKEIRACEAFDRSSGSILLACLPAAVCRLSSFCSRPRQPLPTFRSSPTPTASSRTTPAPAISEWRCSPSFPTSAASCPGARAGVGAVATQSLGNTAYGERGLDLIAQGATAEEALRIVMRTDTMLQDRQVGIVDARGNAASFTGTRTFDWAGGRVGAPSGRGNVLGGKGRSSWGAGSPRRPTSWSPIRR